MTQLEENILNYQTKKFGKINVPASYRKLLEEVGELGEALINKDKQAIMEEIGDVGMLLVTIALAKTDYKSLSVAIATSLEKAESRLRKVKP